MNLKRMQLLEFEYNELLMAVETKHPSESRHQTALRYIREAENKPVAAAKTLGNMENEYPDIFRNL